MSTEAALRAGEVSLDHAHVIARAVRDLPVQAGPRIRAEAEQVSVEHARRFHPKDLHRLGQTVLNAQPLAVGDPASDVSQTLSSEAARLLTRG